MARIFLTGIETSHIKITDSPVLPTDGTNKAYVDSKTSKVKVTDDDTTPGVLQDEIISGSGITLTIVDNAGDKKLEVSSNQEVYIDETPVISHPAISFAQVAGQPGLYDLLVNA